MVDIGCMLRGGSTMGEVFGGVLIEISVIRMDSVSVVSSIIGWGIDLVGWGYCESDALKSSSLKIDTVDTEGEQVSKNLELHQKGEGLY